MERDIMEFAKWGFGPGGRTLQVINSLKQKARRHCAGEAHAELMRTTCGERREDAAGDIAKKYREAAHLVRT